jgi:hypothetical protein
MSNNISWWCLTMDEVEWEPINGIPERDTTTTTRRITQLLYIGSVGQSPCCVFKILSRLNDKCSPSELILVTFSVHKWF